MAERYLAWRGLDTALGKDGARIRGHRELPYYARLGDDGRFRRIYAGPAMVAAIEGADGRFSGVHITWIDPRILIDGVSGAASGLGSGPSVPSGKADIVNPETGEIEPAKKVRGSARAGHIHIAGPAAPERLVVGEGIETTASVLVAMVGDEGWALLETCAFWAGVSLGNIGGRALASIRHPGEMRTDRLGRVRPLMVAGAWPLMDQARPSLMPPESAMDVILLGDGDSDRFTTSTALARAAARWAKPGRTVRAAWADEGQDFNDMLRGAAA